MKDIEIIAKLLEIPLFDFLYQREALERFLRSDCKFMFVDTTSHENPFFFRALDPPLYSALVAKFSSPEYWEVFEFFKLVLEGARLTKQNTEKAKKAATRLEEYLKKLYYGTEPQIPDELREYFKRAI